MSRARRRPRPAAPALAFALGLATLTGAGACGHYTAPVRPPPLGPEEGPVYDAGQPPVPDEPEDGRR